MTELVPKFKLVEHQVQQTISAIINISQVPVQVERYTKLQVKVSARADHGSHKPRTFAKTHRNEPETLLNDSRQDVLLTLNACEATSIKNAKTLFRRMQALQNQGVA